MTWHSWRDPEAAETLAEHFGQRIPPASQRSETAAANDRIQSDASAPASAADAPTTNVNTSENDGPSGALQANTGAAAPADSSALSATEVEKGEIPRSTRADVDSPFPISKP